MHRAPSWPANRASSTGIRKIQEPGMKRYRDIGRSSQHTAC